MNMVSVVYCSLWYITVTLIMCLRHPHTGSGPNKPTRSSPEAVKLLEKLLWECCRGFREHAITG
jgi:hypothetical protein